jgi:hypothetical protein
MAVLIRRWERDRDNVIEEDIYPFDVHLLIILSAKISDFDLLIPLYNIYTYPVWKRRRTNPTP